MGRVVYTYNTPIAWVTIRGKNLISPSANHRWL
jgi:hypothetical protein